MAQATTIALKAHPGQITDRELEEEGGGSGLRYAFDIKSNGKTAEIGVDAWSSRHRFGTGRAHGDAGLACARVTTVR